MIGIKTVAGLSFDLKPDTSISIEQNNELFNFDSSLNGGFSLPFSLPNSYNNRVALGYSNMLDILGDMPEPMPVIILIDGNILFRGLLTVTAAGTNGFDVDILVGKSAISSVTSKKLQELDFGTITMLEDGPTQDEIMSHLYDVAVAPGDYPYVFPVMKNPNAWDDREELNHHNPTNLPNSSAFKYYIYESYINFYEGSYIKNEFTTTTQGNLWNRNSYIPLLKLNYILSRLFDIAGVKIQGSIITDELLKNVYIYNTFNLDKVNLTPVVTFTIGVTNYEAYLTECDNLIQIINHLPDMLASDFIKAIQVMFNLNLQFSPTVDTVKIDCRQDLLTLEPDADWTDKVQPVYKKTQSPQATWYSYSMTPDSDDGFIDDTKALVYKYLEASNRQALETAASYPLMEKDILRLHTYADRDWWIPSVQQKCNNTTATIPTLVNPFSLRLLIYRGLQTDYNGDNFPYASYTDHLPDSVTPYFSNSLQWDGATGLYENRYADWIAFMERPILVESEVILSHTDFLNLDMSRKKRIGNQNYFIKTINVTISNKTAQYLKAKVTLVKAS